MVSQSPALCLINTLRERGGGGEDPISTYGTLGTWLARIGLLPSDAIPLNISHVRQVRELRAATFNCVSAVMAGLPFPTGDVATINRLAAMPSFRPQLVDGRLIMAANRPRTAVLSLLAEDAIEILTLRRERLHRCPNCAEILINEGGAVERHQCFPDRTCS